MIVYRICCLILSLLATQIVYAGGKDTFAYHTIEYLKNNSDTDTSSISDYQDFFEKRITGGSKKYGLCKVLFETDQYVYYGYSLLNSEKERITNQYYRTDKHILKEKFPLYKKEVWYELWDNGEGYVVKDKYRDSLKKAGHINLPSLDDIAVEYYRLTDYIEKDHVFYRKHWFWKNIISVITCTTYFDKETLAVVRTSVSEQEYDRKSKKK